MSRLLIDQRVQCHRGFAHLRVWELTEPLHPSRHHFKYRLAYLEGERVRVLYEVHAGKPDHKQIDGKERPYELENLETLATEFFKDVEELPE